MKKLITFCLLLLSVISSYAQPDRWQQRIKYVINVDMNVATNRFTGTEKIDYWNNSPDTLNRVFFHLYWNAFQPGSMMDVRSQELGQTILGTDKSGNDIRDWSLKIKDRISKLKPDEIGYQKVKYVKINGAAQKLIEHETILEVDLDKPLLPHSKTSLDVSFEAQVPLQIRRSGRDNAEHVRYSMSQWYPKMVEYDYQGWNANPYIAREFYGVWGDYDVNITIDKTYMLAGTGIIQNPNEVGFGYQADNVRIKAPEGSTLTWKFSAQNVHDFVWAADPDFIMQKRQIKNGPLIYAVYKKSDAKAADWYTLADSMELIYPYIAKTFGAYTYKNYSFIEGGDGGMEYPMATLINSPGSAIHEWLHNWYQGILANNESLYGWMDEGFVTYASARVNGWRHHDSTISPFASAYDAYFKLAKSKMEEPLSTHADHFNTNYACETGSYRKGAIFIKQLGYIVSDSVLDKILLAYYNQWRFKHPNPNDFVRVAEKVSAIELQWYKEYWIYTTKTIDYAIGDVATENGATKIKLNRIGLMPMPVDVLITYKDGSKEMHYVPMNLMYGAKPAEDATPRIIHNEWKWVDREYTLTISRNVADIKEIEIDPSKRMADVNRINNKITVP